MYVCYPTYQRGRRGLAKHRRNGPSLTLRVVIILKCATSKLALRVVMEWSLADALTLWVVMGECFAYAAIRARNAQLKVKGKKMLGKKMEALCPIIRHRETYCADG